MRYKIEDQNGLYFLTMTIVEWIDLFTRPTYKDIIVESLKYCQKEKGLVISAFVIMPSHLHLILNTNNEKGLSSIIQGFKSYTANQILNYIKDFKQPESRREWLLNHFAFNARKNNRHSQHQVWQKDNHPIILYSPKVIRQKLDYLHYNPVKDKIVAQPEHYYYSSASNYKHGSGILDISKIEDIWDDTGYVMTDL